VHQEGTWSFGVDGELLLLTPTGVTHINPPIPLLCHKSCIDLGTEVSYHIIQSTVLTTSGDPEPGTRF